MPEETKSNPVVKSKTEPKQYFQQVPRKFVYGGLALFALIATLLYLMVPHYKTFANASDTQIGDAHYEIIQKFFVANTKCKNDNLEYTLRVKAFNKYFQVNQYGNRAVFRGCNDKDVLLIKDAAGTWQRTGVTLNLAEGVDPELQRECLLRDITKGNASLRATDKDLETCASLAKEAYVEVHLNSGIKLNF